MSIGDNFFHLLPLGRSRGWLLPLRFQSVGPSQCSSPSTPPRLSKPAGDPHALEQALRPVEKPYTPLTDRSPFCRRLPLPAAWALPCEVPEPHAAHVTGSVVRRRGYEPYCRTTRPQRRPFRRPGSSARRLTATNPARS